MHYTNPVTEGLVLLASLGFIVAIYYAYRLYGETRGEKYWAHFLLAALAFGIHEWAVIPVELHWISAEIGILVEEIAAIVGALAFAYASYGIYSSMKRIREHMHSANKKRA